jgi:hypothetical protein
MKMVPVEIYFHLAIRHKMGQYNLKIPFYNGCEIKLINWVRNIYCIYRIRRIKWEN